MSVLEIKDIHKSFGSLNVLNGVNLSVHKGDVIAILGPSGSGKTTLLRCINFLETADQGTMVFDEKEYDLASMHKNDIRDIRKKTGFVFQNYSLIKHLRVWENIELPLLYAKKSFTAKQRHEIITGLLKSVGLESKENDYPINLSGGEQQRVAIARALAVSPEAILCDEPTGALDKKTGTQIMELLHSVVKENGIMLLLVTHDPDIADTCDTIFEMDGGRITCAKNDT